MTTDENILIEMFAASLERATNPLRDTVDNLAVQIFCMMLQGNNDLVSKAHELIIKKMHSSNIIEATRAIGILEECMSKGGSEFQKKTAKFTFLNELIALVLDKHSGAIAPIETKKRVMECLMLWTVEFQDKTKIQETYDNLKKQVNFTHNLSTTNSIVQDLTSARDQRCSILGKDDQLVAKLVRQGGAENYKKANLLIQHRFNQEAKRAEFICHLKNELKKIENTMVVLEEMLNSYNSDGPEADSCDIIQELYNNCKGHYEQLARWPDFLADSEPEFLEDVLNTKELLMIVMQRYKDVFENEQHYSVHGKPNASTSNVDLLPELLGDTLSASSESCTNPINTKNPVEANDTLNDLNEIFGSVIDKIEINKSQHPSELLRNLDLLEPINVFETENSQTANSDKEEKKEKGLKELTEIDKLSEEMFKQSLNEERLLSFKKGPKKVALNDMAKNKFEASLNTTSLAKSNINVLIKSNEGCQNSEKLNTNIKDLQEHNETDVTNSFENKGKDDDNLNVSTPKALAEISIDLDEVTPLDDGQRLLLDDDDIQVTLNFTADRPSRHVSVIVVTVTNKSKLLVKDFQFEASAKKPCKVRLLPPTAVVMAPRKHFTPSTPINQVILLLNPTQKPVDITCIIGYKIGDDPDPIKESVLTKDVPYV